MAGFLYFIPDTQTVGEAKGALARAGASYVHELGGSWPHIGAGPTGAGGVILAPNPPPGGEQATAVFDPKGQDWREAPGGAYWIGHVKGSPPTPSDLARECRLAGHEVTLGDGNAWLVPVARLSAGEATGIPALPQVVRLDPEGNPRPEILEEWNALWDLACRFWDEWIAAVKGAAAIIDRQDRTEAGLDPGPELPLPPAPGAFIWVGWTLAGAILNHVGNCFRLTAELLTVNYRVGPLEVAELGLVNSDTCLDAPRATVDWPSEEEFEVTPGKKAEAGASVTQRGSAV